MPKERLYRDLASWWPLFSSTADYRKETRPFGRLLRSAGRGAARTVLELGSGGGNNAFYLKREFELTLVDPSPGMLRGSLQLNPECDHVQGDMRSARLRRTFDRVFIHDAIMHMITLTDLRRALMTAFVHTRPGGGLVVAPDCTEETYMEISNRGGHDGKDGRALRYLEWNFDEDPTDGRYDVHFVYLLREKGKQTRALHDVHTYGLFKKAAWLRVLRDAGFRAKCVDDPELRRDVFIGIRPETAVSR